MMHRVILILSTTLACGVVVLTLTSNWFWIGGKFWPTNRAVAIVETMTAREIYKDIGEHRRRYMVTKLKRKSEASASMLGHRMQSHRPIAAALALRNVLSTMAERAIAITSDSRKADPYELIEPRGDASLAAGLVTPLCSRPDAVLVISDGHENAPGGRFAEVVAVARGSGVHMLSSRYSSVFATETGGVRARE